MASSGETPADEKSAIIGKGEDNLFGNVKCDVIIDTIRCYDNCDERYVFNHVSLADHAYIMVNFGYLDDCKKRITFFSDSQELIVTMHGNIHNAILSPIIFHLSRVIRSIGHLETTVQVQVSGNTHFDGDLISANPDINITIVSLVQNPQFSVPAPLWITECVFTQTDADVMEKLARYINDCPSLIAVSKITIEEEPSFSQPTQTASKFIHNHPRLLTFAEWMPKRTPSNYFGPVTTHGHTWANLSAITIHVWVRTSNSPIDINSEDPSCYSKGTIYPIMQLESIDAKFKFALEKIRDQILLHMHCSATEAAAEDSDDDDKGSDADENEEAIESCLPPIHNNESKFYNAEHIDEDLVFQTVASWTPTFPIIDWKEVKGALVTGIWTTAYTRYKHWYNSKREGDEMVTNSMTSGRGGRFEI